MSNHTLMMHWGWLCNQQIYVNSGTGVDFTWEELQ